jgi:hypothetical protein
VASDRALPLRSRLCSQHCAARAPAARYLAAALTCELGNAHGSRALSACAKGAAVKALAYQHPRRNAPVILVHGARRRGVVASLYRHEAAATNAAVFCHATCFSGERFIHRLFVFAAESLAAAARMGAGL